jgi:D-beta-D-heptose 7-phosphate kinase/D-beta-D-heptose 1-phosphate adenosyltransferase
MIISFDATEKMCLDLHRNGKQIVFTNGCFDIIHAGHVTYLKKAKALGDLLFVGLNTDSSVKRLKGENRPLNTETDRAMSSMN